MPNLAEKMNAKQQQASRILEDALDEHRRAVDFPELISAALRRRICHHFALYLSDRIDGGGDHSDFGKS